MNASVNISILIVDDDKELSVGVERVLNKEGYATKTASNLFQAQGVLSRFSPDLILLDRQLPDGDGADFCVKLKRDEKTNAIPILFLSGKREVADRVLGLELGGDGYLPKPFSNAELLAMIKSILRRTMKEPTEAFILELGPLRIDIPSRKAYLDDQELDLRVKEFDLLRVFAERPGRVLTRETLLQLAWGADKELELSMKGVDVAVSRLRSKLGRLGEKLSAERGYGYRFDVQ